MIIEKKRLLIFRIIMLIIMVFMIIFPFAFGAKKLKLGMNHAYQTYDFEYNGYRLDSKESKLTQKGDMYYLVNDWGAINQIIFAENGIANDFKSTITVQFYNGTNELSKVTVRGDRGAYLIEDVPDLATSYKIVDYTLYQNNFTALIVCLSIAGASLLLLLFSFIFNYKYYSLYEGCEILVYAGAFKQYIKFNGEIIDEHNTLNVFSSAHLSCTMSNGDEITITIPASKIITLKLNNNKVKPIAKVK